MSQRSSTPAPATPTLPQARLAPLHAAVLTWYARQQRALPWRATRDPYRVLVAEIMLQQTQVDRVLTKYAAFLAEFPTVETLAAAPRAAVVRAWEGMGYNLRAVRLHQTAQRVAARGGFPDTLEGLLALPGLGPYTARAVACFAFGQQVGVVDTNVRRVLRRLLYDAIPDQRSDAAMIVVAEAALPDGRAYDWNQALMDLGATVCTARRPRCLLCPVAEHCAARTSGALAAELARAESGAARSQPFTGSDRYFRGRIVAALRNAPGHTFSVAHLREALPPDAPPLPDDRLLRLLEGLVRDGLCVWRGDGEERQVTLP